MNQKEKLDLETWTLCYIKKSVSNYIHIEDGEAQNWKKNVCIKIVLHVQSVEKYYLEINSKFRNEGKRTK